MRSMLMRLLRRPPTVSAYLALLVALGGGAYATAATVAATSSAAPDSRPPRIVAAVMQDADGDGRADRLRLTYSERVRHAADRDGRYPFRVAGYRIRAVGKASGRAILLRLVETSEADDAARPTVRYTRTRADRVLDRARKQAASQLFRATRAHGNPPAATQTPLPQESPATGTGGNDTPDPEDCAPADPDIGPGALDQPDLAFVDSNCDGIDGSEKDAIFVSQTGMDTNPGTRAAPKETIQAGIVAAALAGKDVYVASGDYGRVGTVSDVDIYGGYLPNTWARNVDARTRIVGQPEAVLASGDSVLLQLMTLVGLNGGPGSSAYGLRAVAGSRLTLQRVTSIANGGVAGTNGATGANGVAGGNGGRGVTGSCDTEFGGEPGGPGASPAGFPGGQGGHGGIERLDHDGGVGWTGAVGTLGGAGGLNGNPGKPGQRGANGADGAPGTHGRGGVLAISTAALSAWRGIDGANGTSGAPGMGGGGGGGGGGQAGAFVIDGIGNGGGGGGGGGGRGTGGTGGGAGGGSFAVYLHDATATLSAGSSVQAGDGGRGGAGGAGGLPAFGGAGGRGATWCTGELGAGGDGGHGGTGGIGGGGGGGAGGPSIGVMKAGASTATLTDDVTIQVGTPGAAGAAGGFGSGGTPAEPGIARAVYP